jgi:hypothetical protein
MVGTGDWRRTFLAGISEQIFNWMKLLGGAD